VRIIAATHWDLTELAAQHKFREDLYYRLKVVTIALPPLRDRISDLPLLFDFFLKKYSAKQNKTLAVHPDVLACLEGYDWPGNVRQLENAVERAWLSTPRSVRRRGSAEEMQVARTKPLKPREGGWLTLAEMEERYIQEVVTAFNGNITRAAEILASTAARSIAGWIAAIPSDGKSRSRDVTGFCFCEICGCFWRRRGRLAHYTAIPTHKRLISFFQ